MAAMVEVAWVPRPNPVMLCMRVSLPGTAEAGEWESTWVIDPGRWNPGGGEHREEFGLVWSRIDGLV